MVTANSPVRIAGTWELTKLVVAAQTTLDAPGFRLYQGLCELVVAAVPDRQENGEG